MTPARRYAVGLLLTACAVGLIRGMIVGRLFHLSWGMTGRITLGQIALASFWIPVALIALAIFDGQLPGTGRWAAVVALGAVAALLEPTLVPLLGVMGANPPPYWTRFANRSDTNLLFFLAVAGAGAAVSARRRQIRADLAAARLETAVADAQLHVLTLQLHPHFLFNALNLVSQLAYENVDAARRTIANLRSLLIESLRHALHREVSLAEEIRFLRAYLEIQEARFRGRLFSTIIIAEGAENAAVPHLLLQPLVENAILHGLAGRAEPGHLEITAHRADSRLILSVRDDGEGVRGALREGLGLGNTRLRLDQLFAGDYRLELIPARDGGTIVVAEIPYRVVAADVSSLSDDAFDASFGSADPELPAPNARPRAALWAQVVAAWTGIAMLWTELRTHGQLPSSAPIWSTIMTSGAINAAWWAVLTPLVVRYTGWAGLAGPRSKRFVLAHVAGAVAASVGHTALWVGTLYLIGSADLSPTIRSVFGWMIWDAGAYAAIASLTTFVALTSRLHDARVAMAQHRARLAEARVAALRLRLQPRVLIGSLDALERVVSIDAEQSEAAIARMGDLLRVLLARAAQEWVDVDEEVELLTAYLDVVNAWRGASDEPASRVIVACGEERIPAMLLTTIAASIGGNLDEIAIREVGSSISIDAFARDGSLDHRAIAEMSQRLAELYHGNERLTSGRTSHGELFVRVAIPASESPRIESDSIYGFASA